MYGWKNYETWRIKGLFDWRTPQDICGTDSVTAEELRRNIESLIDVVCDARGRWDESLFFVCDFAKGSLLAVDWEEIAEAINAEPQEEHRMKNRKKVGSAIPPVI
jgi:hypothetical protein